jgi:hypothetical protein
LEIIRPSGSVSIKTADLYACPGGHNVDKIAKKGSVLVTQVENIGKAKWLKKGK